MSKLVLTTFFIALLTLTACSENGDAEVAADEKNHTTNWDSVYSSQGLVKISDLPGVITDLRYSSENNFTGKDIYGDLETAWLRPKAAKMLETAVGLLKERNASLNILIYDSARPRRVQQILWDTVELPADEKPMYVANPQSGSIHNYGFAVDLTLAGPEGKELDMGTDYDDFSTTAHTDRENELIAEGKLTAEEVQNRCLLRSVMTEAGFIPLQSEWWHFDALPRNEVVGQYAIIE